MKSLNFIIIALSLNSCYSPSEMYYSVAQNAPLLTQKNELRISAAALTETYGRQAAYAFSKSFGVIGSYSNGLNFNIGRSSVEFAVVILKHLRIQQLLKFMVAQEGIIEILTAGILNRRGLYHRIHLELIVPNRLYNLIWVLEITVIRVSAFPANLVI